MGFKNLDFAFNTRATFLKNVLTVMAVMNTWYAVEECLISDEKFSEN